MWQKSCFLSVLALLLTACSYQDKTYDASSYNCTNDFVVDSSLHPKHSELQQALVSARKEGLIGISILIHNADGFWVGAEGSADLAAEALFSACSLSAIGSTTKTMVAALTVKLQEAGLISLSDKAATYLKADVVANISNLDRVTIEQLLNHTSGIYNYTDTAAYLLDMLGNMNNPDHQPSTQDRLDYISGVDAYFEPGKGHTYSNTNYLLVDLVLEAATGKPLSQLMQEYVFTPLALDSTVYDPSVSYTSGQVQGYFDGHGSGKFRNNTLAEGGARTAHGGALSNVFDLYTFFNAILDTGAGYLTQASIDAIQNWVPFPYNNTSEDSVYGLGLGKKNTSTSTILSHAGKLPNGYNADMRYYVEQQTTIIYLTNSASATFEPASVVKDFVIEAEAILFGI